MVAIEHGPASPQAFPGVRSGSLFASLTTGLVLLTAMVLPPFGIAFGASSMAGGVFVVVWLSLLLFAALCALQKPPRGFGNGAFVIIAILALIFIHGAVSFMVNASFDFGRFWQTYAFLILYVAAACSLALLAQKLSKRQVSFAVKFVFYALLLCGVGGIVGFRPFFGKVSSVVLFSENSHYVLAFLPVLLYMTVLSCSKRKWVLPLMGLVMALLLQSLTLIVGVIAIAICTFRLKYLVFVLLAAIPILVAAIQYTDVTYYSSRLDLSSDSTNITSLVYIRGWQTAYLNLKDYYGMGVGFQQMGIVSESALVEGLVTLGADDMNVLDGSFVAAKFISEFGIVALAALLIYLRYLARSVRWLRRVSMNPERTDDYRKKVFFVACFVMFVIDLFIRGTGYFSSSGFLFLISLAWMALNRRNNPSVQLSRQGGVIRR